MWPESHCRLTLQLSHTCLVSTCKCGHQCSHHRSHITQSTLATQHIPAQSLHSLLSAQAAVRAQKKQLQQQLPPPLYPHRQVWVRRRRRTLGRRAKQCCMRQRAPCFSLMTRTARRGESGAAASSDSTKLPMVHLLLSLPGLFGECKS